MTEGTLAGRAPLVPPATERLVFALHRVEDFAECAGLWGDPDVTRFIGGRPLTAEETWTRLLRYAGLWSLLGFGYWAVRDRASGRYVGDVGFADLQRSIDPPLDGRPEIGWVLAPWAHGRGLATEAVRTAVAWGDANLDHPETVCIIRPDHERSIRVAERVGYRPTGPAEYLSRPMTIFSRARAASDRGEVDRS